MSGKPQREETPPTWLNTAFIENALKKGLKNDEFKIIESEMKMATSVGDNYGSLMFRFNLIIKTKPGSKEEKFSVIVKAIPPGLIGEELRKLAAFEKEGEALSKTLPAISKLLNKAYPDHKKLWPDCYYHQESPDNLLVMEDLGVSGYVIGSRLEGLDMEHSVLVLKSLAKLHAASLVLEKENPKSLEIMKKTFWDADNSQSVQKMFTAPFRVLSKEVLNWTDSEKREIWSEKLKNMEETSMEMIFKLWEKDESKLNVLLHGDSWVNNFMFKYNPAGKLSGINFVDFQMMNVNTPVLDLQYFIFTSISPDLRFDYIDLFLKTYHETFEDTLKRLGHRLEVQFGFEQLKKDFEEKYVWGFIVFCTIFPHFILPSSEVIHPDEFFNMDEGSSFEKTYKRDNLRKILKRGFQFFDEKRAF